MSLLLKGIDLEEITAGNGYARLEIEEDGTVVDDISDIIIGYAIQIPTPHGRLIDADDIYIGRWDIDSDIADQRQNAPTI